MVRMLLVCVVALALLVVIVQINFLSALIANAATQSTRVLADGVPIEIVFVSDDGELVTPEREFETDDYNHPLPNMPKALCTSLEVCNYCVLSSLSRGVRVFGVSECFWFLEKCAFLCYYLLSWQKLFLTSHGHCNPRNWKLDAPHHT